MLTPTRGLLEAILDIRIVETTFAARVFDKARDKGKARYLQSFAVEAVLYSRTIAEDRQ
jgi:hypothetical protein